MKRNSNINEAEVLLDDLFRINKFGQRSNPYKKENKNYFKLNKKEKERHISSLIANGANLEKNIIKCTSFGTLQELEIFVDLGVDYNYVNNKKEFPLLKAIQRNQLEKIQFFTNLKDIKINKFFNNMDIVSICLNRKNYELANLFFKKYHIRPSNKINKNNDNSFLFWIKQFNYTEPTKEDLEQIYKWINVYSKFTDLNFTNKNNENYSSIFKNIEIISYINKILLKKSLKTVIKSKQIII